MRDINNKEELIKLIQENPKFGVKIDFGHESVEMV